MRSVPISSNLFSRNRSRLLSLLPESSLALLDSNPRMVRNGDQFYPYRQHSNFFYLTGIAQQGSFLMLSSEGVTLFIRKPDPKTLLWTGPLISMEEAKALSGITDIRWLDDLDSSLEKLAEKVGSLFLSPHSDGEISKRATRLFPYLEQASLDSLMTGLRMIKEPEEVEAIRKACAITRSAFLSVVEKLKPGMREFGVEAEITAEFIREGAQGHAFEPIVASGANALILHYVENDGICRDGELVLMDFGAELNNYAADCSRTLPIGGKFTKRQRELYDSVHQVFIQARKLMLPGVKMDEFHKQVGELWEEQHLKLGLYTRKEAEKMRPTELLWKKYYMHGTSHSLGLDVHDPFAHSEPFAPGMILTCEPGIYIANEGIGIRLENDILITEDGPIDLMETIPIEAEEIEDLLQSNGNRR